MKKDFYNIKSHLLKSKFRSSFHLKEKDFAYIKKHGLEKIEKDAYDLILKRLAPVYPKNDTRQTPFGGHPVFVAQHATATCCRKCLQKWHGIQAGKELSREEIDYVVFIIMDWIQGEIDQIFICNIGG